MGQLLTNHLSYLISKMWSLYTLSQSLTGIELLINFILLVLTIVKGFDKGCGYSLYYTIIMIILLGCLSTEFSGIKKKQFGALVFSCVFRVMRLALSIAGLIMSIQNLDQEIDLHFVVIPLMVIFAFFTVDCAYQLGRVLTQIKLTTITPKNKNQEELTLPIQESFKV